MEKNIGVEKVIVPITNNIVDMNCVFTINEVGSFIYNQMNGSKTLEEIYTSLLTEFEVSPEVAKPDFEKFINNSLKSGLLFIQK